ncbi:late competence protein ComER [Brevibacillus dissolubilis]|uniref:late competence protein ComER n=1 Tax=Brevibacillus dissolubilis TaxID=1844116 RepID=UPI0011173630|nr:late competence protein ComER [Brevibacillus dissolubilis]
MQVGFIGTGSMGSILINALISQEALQPSQIVASNRTPSKVEALAQVHSGLQVAYDNKDVAKKSDVLFLCVKPLEYRKALEQMADALTPKHLLITITSPVRIAELEQYVPCAVARVIPSITNAAASGLTLLEYGSRVVSQQREWIVALFSKISHPVEIEDQYLRVASDICSCGPAFMSYILQQMIQSAVEETSISRDAAVQLTTHMIIGLADLLKAQHFTLPELQQRVCVPGGITGEGLKALEKGIPGVFNDVFKRTHEKFAEDRVEMSKQFIT